VENYDVELFMKTVTDYDSTTKLDPFLTQLLLKTKKMINPESQSGSGEGKEGEEEGDMLT